MAQKLWEKNVQVNAEIDRFTVGRDREMDMYLAKYDVLGSMAHITMLESIGLLTSDELKILLEELKNIYASVERGEFVIEDGIEDVHSQVELMLTRRLGDVGKKIHSGRSRNDQVLVDLKLFIRAQLKSVAEAVERLFHVLISQSNRYKDVLMPGYTHLQIAMPSSFGLWFGAYAESLVDDMMFLQAAYKTCNRNPLGSAAGYGSSFPLDREMTTRLLGFDSMNYNVVYAQMGRGKVERNVSFALASIAGTLSKMAFDACMFSCQNFGFVKLPDECTTGSSIMPHKKNPDVFELTRAKCRPIISGMAMLKETTPVVLMAWSMPIEAEELWSRAVTAAPTATPRRGLEKAVNTDWNSGRSFSGSTAEDMVFMPMNSRPRPSTIWPTMRLCPPLMNM